MTIKRSDEAWLRFCPHHVTVVGVDLEAVDWCLDNLAPTDWHHKVVGALGEKKTPVDLFAFKDKTKAVMFKLMWHA